MNNNDMFDVPILLIFFARPQQFQKVFEQIKLIKPRTLFLYQDGPRFGREDDIAAIKECRKIVEEIDWDCDLHKKYQIDNFGCDPSEYIAQKWAFSIADRCIILEDDDVPSQSFFYFCKELLEKYKDDERINMICGMNNTGISHHIEESYLFSTSGSITGWASWKRVVDTWDDSYNFLSENKSIYDLRKNYVNKIDVNHFLKNCIKHKASGKVHYESILSSSALLNSRLNIVPTKNLISNIGVTENATHSVSNIKMLPKGIRIIFNMKTYEIEFPLKHPKYVLEDYKFRKELYRIMAVGHPFVRIFRKIESVLLRLKYGDFKGLKKSLKNKFKKKD